VIEHKRDADKNISVVINVLEGGASFEWVGLPNSMKIDLNRFERNFQRNYPDVCLRTILMQQEESTGSIRYREMEALMTSEQVKKRLEDAVVIKRENPALVYKIVKKIGKGGFGVIFEVVRISDSRTFALKFTTPKNRAERQNIINEASLYSFLDCDQLIRCEEVYEY